MYYYFVIFLILVNKVRAKMKLGKEKCLVIIFTACGCLCLLYDWERFHSGVIVHPKIYSFFNGSRNLRLTAKYLQNEPNFERLNFKSAPHNSIRELCMQNVTKDVNKTNMKYPMGEETYLKPWKQLLASCDEKMFFQKHFNMSNITSTEESEPELLRSVNKTSLHLKLYSKNKRKEYKTVGGDFWKVTVYNKYVSFVVDMIDNNDGSYEAVIKSDREGEYNIKLVLFFSDCEGLMDPPSNYFKIGKGEHFYSTFE